MANTPGNHADLRSLRLGGRRRQRGVSLIEAGIATSLVAVLASLGAPSFGEMRDRRMLEGVSAELGTDLQYVRSEAVARNESVRLTTRQLGDGACYVIHTGPAAGCNCTMQGPAVCTGGAVALKTVSLPISRRVSLGVSSASMLWHPVRGTVTPTGTLRLSTADGRAIHHVVNIMGRARACSPEGKVAGTPVC
jgi:type IV fimbrial biogenesis protein FimT